MSNLESTAPAAVVSEKPAPGDQNAARCPVWRRERVVVSIFFAVLVLLGLGIHRNYGLFWDELDLRHQMGEIFLDYATGGHRQNLVSIDINVYHGPALEMVYVAIERGLGLKDLRVIFQFRHLLNYLLFIGAVFAFYRLCRGWFEPWGFALLGAALLVLCPRIFSDHFYNTKDASFLSLYVICLYTMVRFCRRPGLLNAALHALACGFLIDVRNLGILIPPLTLLLLAGEWVREPELRRPRRWLPGLAAFIILLPLFTILFWPTLWRYPVSHFIQALKINGSFPWYGDVLFMGKRVLAMKVPWYYAPVWIGVTLPPIHLFLFLAGLAAAGVAALRGLRAFVLAHWTARTPLLSAFYTIGAPLGAVIVLHATLYNGWRHLYFIFPALVAIGLFGAQALWSAAAGRLWLRRAMALTTALSLLVIVLQMIRLHPYEHLYFNRLAGRDLDQAKHRFEGDSMGLSYRAGLEYIVAHDNSPMITVVVANAAGEYNAVLLPVKDRQRLRFTEQPGEADYFVSNYSNHLAPYVFTDEVFALKRGGTTVLSVFRLRAPPQPAAAASTTAAP